MTRQAQMNREARGLGLGPSNPYAGARVYVALERWTWAPSHLQLGVRLLLLVPRMGRCFAAGSRSGTANESGCICYIWVGSHHTR